MNITEIGQSLIGVTNAEGLKIVGNLFLPSILIAWAITLLITTILAIKTIKKDWANFFLIFILPNLIFFVLILFIFVTPFLPEWTANWLAG